MGDPVPGAFFIVGAPRCGTTALSKYLKAHPSICFSSPKETNFFVSVSNGSASDTLRRQFLKAFFEPPGEAVRLYGEGSVSTIYSRAALTRILDCFPQARFIVMLRNPVEQLASYHARLLYMRQETEADFATAWDLQEARRAGRRIPRSCFDARLLQYSEVGRLGHYTAQLFDLAGRERCLPILFEDFSGDTACTYRRALEFLGVPDDGRTDFRRRNQQQRFTSSFWQSFYAGALLGPVGRLLARHPQHLARLSRATRRLRKRFRRRHSVDVILPTLDPAMEMRLRKFFADDIRHLGQLLGCDLSHWLSDPGESQLTDGHDEDRLPAALVGG